MPRLVCFELEDGRSMIANCDTMTTDRLKRARGGRARVTLTADDAVEEVAADAIKDFHAFDVAMDVPERTRIFNFVQVASW